MALSRILAMAMGLAGALGASQGPEFAQQYAQRLGGAIEELETVVARFDDGAAEAGLDRAGAIDRLEQNADDLVRRQGESARLAADRLETLRAKRQRMDAAGDLGRVVALVREADPQIARGTYETYRPAVPVTAEGALAAVLGFVVMWLVAFGGAKSAKFAGRKGMEVARARFAKAKTAPADDGRPKVYRREDA